MTMAAAPPSLPILVSAMPPKTAHLLGDEMTDQQVTDLRAYCLQWMKGSWMSDMARLTAQLEAATTQALLSAWMDDALEVGIDPLKPGNVRQITSGNTRGCGKTRFEI